MFYPLDIISAPFSLIRFAHLGYSDHDSAHNYKHAVRVLINAQEILNRENIVPTLQEIEELPYVMLGHDLRDHKLIAAGKCLPAEEIEKFYISELGEDSARKILHIHENCSWSNRKTATPLPTGDWMRLLLQDADWLDALGDSGLMRCIEFTKEYIATLDCTADDIPSLVCKHIKEKLLLIPNELNFESSKKIVEENNLLEPLLVYLSLHE